jgi:tetratricopeptide (TPR) repeat protein
LPPRVYVPIVLVAGAVFIGVVAYFLRIGLSVEGSALGPGAAPASRSSIEPVATRAPGEVAIPQSGGALPNAGGALPGNSVGGGGPAGGPPAPVARLVADLKARIARNPQDLSALVGLAGLYAEANKVAQAEPLYARALAIDPNNPDTRTDYARVLHEEGRDVEALRQTGIVLEKRRDFPPALFAEGVAAGAIGRRTQAIEAYRRFVQVAPNDPHVDDARAALRALGAA